MVLIHITGLFQVYDKRHGIYDYDGNYETHYILAFLWPVTVPLYLICGLFYLLRLLFWFWINFLYSKITGEKWYY